MTVVSIASARARRVDNVRVGALLLSPSVPALHETAVTLTRDGLAADWAAIVDRSGIVLASTSAEMAGRGTMLAAVAWGSATDPTGAVMAALVAEFGASMLVGRRTRSFDPTDRERLGVIAGMVGVVWGHLDDGRIDDGHIDRQAEGASGHGSGTSRYEAPSPVS